MQPLRPYQASARAGVHGEWRRGKRRVLLVAPTGSGKTRMGEELVADARRDHEHVLWGCHRRELLKQAADRLRERFGRLAVGIIAPGHDYEPHAEIQVATVQTLLARGARPPASLLVLDEGHHYVADDWKKLSEAYPRARSLLLTATPERQDGKPLGDVADTLVVAAQYSELLRDGYLVPCAVFQPPEGMGSGLAQDPLTAYQRYAENSRAFVFCSSVKEAYELAARFTEAGITSAVVEAHTPKLERDDILERFAQGRITCVMNVYALTEGVDVPAARTCLLARGCQHVGGYLQIVGRVLRPFPGKPHAILIDLTGATLLHGMPTEDRIYSLDGEGIKRTSLPPVRQCPQCGSVVAGRPTACPECGFVFPISEAKQPRIYDLELRAVFAGSETPEAAKAREFQRLRTLAKNKGFDLYFVQKEYKKLFGEDVVIPDATPEEKLEEFNKLRALTSVRGFKRGFAAIRFRQLFGEYPPQSWRAAQ